MRADLAHELDDVELIPRDDRVVRHGACVHLRDDAAHFVELLDGLAQLSSEKSTP